MKRTGRKTPQLYHVCVLTHPVDYSHLDIRDFGSEFLCRNRRKGVCLTALGNTDVQTALVTLMCTELWATLMFKQLWIKLMFTELWATLMFTDSFG